MSGALPIHDPVAVLGRGYTKAAKRARRALRLYRRIAVANVLAGLLNPGAVPTSTEAAEADWKKALRHQHDLFSALADMPAHTGEGFAAKARALASANETTDSNRPSRTDYLAMVESIEADTRRAIGRGGEA